MRRNTSEKGKEYSRLSLQEREETAIALKQGKSRRAVARLLGRAPSSITREINRNNDTPVRFVKYRASPAQKRADLRKKESHTRQRLTGEGVRAYAEAKLPAGWTPGLIAGRLPQDIPGAKTNYESIYQWIYPERPGLVKYPVRNHKKRHKRTSGKKSRAGKIPSRADITKRPAGAENRSRRGHWEAGTVVSRNGKQAAAVFVERKNRYYIAVKMKNKTAEEMLRAAIKALGFLPSHMRRSITFDNGLENALREKISAALGTQSYFCKPYHSREKGSIENRNGILRRYFPKKHSWGLTTQKELNNIVDRINNTPMKCLRFRTPYEVFADQGGVALAA